MSLKIFTPEGTKPDAGAIQQIQTCMTSGNAVAGSLSADHHLGYSAPIGGTIGYADYVSPSSVGYDIGCGNKAVATSLRFSDIADDMDRIMDEVVRRISFGMGQPATEQTPHTIIDKIGQATDGQIRGLKDLAAKQLGTVGSGNPEVVHEVHNHHNFSWEEEHFGQQLWVVRKGATPLFPGQQGFVGGSMGENAVIIEGSLDFYPDAFNDGEDSLWSAPHGAGRAMSRTEAKGKQRKRQHCTRCGWTQQPGEAAQAECPKCWHSGIKKGGLTKKWVTEKAGRIDWQETLGSLARKGIVLRGGDADEAPGAYKRLPAVLAAHYAYVTVKHQLRPVGVAMAGRGTRDDYKD